MLKGKLIHPEILHVLGRSGHGSKILIADGNFPFSTKTCAAAEKVFLNFAPGLIDGVKVLEGLVSVIPVESALVMAPPETGDFAVGTPDIWHEYERVLNESGNDLKLERVGRFNFYEHSASTDVSLVIATGEQKIFANLLLTIGVVK